MAKCVHLSDSHIRQIDVFRILKAWTLSASSTESASQSRAFQLSRSKFFATLYRSIGWTQQPILSTKVGGRDIETSSHFRPICKCTHFWSTRANLGDLRAFEPSEKSVTLRRAGWTPNKVIERIKSKIRENRFVGFESQCTVQG